MASIGLILKFGMKILGSTCMPWCMVLFGKDIWKGIVGYTCIYKKYDLQSIGIFQYFNSKIILLRSLLTMNNQGNL